METIILLIMLGAVGYAFSNSDSIRENWYIVLLFIFGIVFIFVG